MELFEADFRNLSDSAPVLIWVSGIDRKCLYVNRRWCDFTGQTPVEALGTGWRQVLHPDDFATVMEAGDRGFHTIEPFSVEFRMRRADGEYRWMISNASPRFNASGDWIGFIGTSIEIHNERLLREQAISYQRRLEEFFEKTPVMMHSINSEGVIVGVSDDWLSHFGYTREEVIGRNRTEFMSPASMRVAHTRMKKFLDQGHCEHVDYQFLTKSGEVRDVKLTAIAETDIEGRFIKSIAVLEDITESNKSLRRLQQSQLVFDQSSEAIFWVSLDGKLLYVNQQACTSLEYTAEELLKMSIWDIDPEFTQESWSQIDWISRLQERRFLRSIHQTKSGRQFPVEVNSKVMDIGDEVFACAFVRDLTQTLRNESELLLTQRRLEETLRSGNIGLWDWDMTTDEVLFSSEWKTQVGLPPDAQLNGYLSWEERVHPEDRDHAIARIEDYILGATPDYVSVFRFRHENGSYRWIHAQGRVFKDATGKPERMIGVHVDLTEHKHALQQLADRTAELEAIFQASPDIFFRTDRSGVIMDYRVSSDANLMMPPEEFLGKRMRDLVPPRVKETYDHAFANLQGTGQSQTVEYRMRIAGHNAWYQAVFVPFQEAQVAIFIRDISDRKSSELDLIARTHDLERSNSDLDQFAYVASHDLKTPLRGIQHLTKWIREDSAGQLPAECNIHLDRLDEQVQRMQSLLDDLLQYSRAGRIRVAVEPIDLREMVDEIIGLVHPPAGMKIELVQDDVQMVTGRAPLFHVLLNLVENAVKYHHRTEGSIRIRVTEGSDIEYVMFEVRDDGPGIEKEHHARIFRMFQRLDARKTGTGMGLAVVRKMIESRGGMIQIVSQLGQGTTFYFTWPGMRDLPEALFEDEDE